VKGLLTQARNTDLAPTLYGAILAQSGKFGLTQMARMQDGPVGSVVGPVFGRTEFSKIGEKTAGSPAAKTVSCPELIQSA
jgi:hypothetical protein